MTEPHQYSGSSPGPIRDPAALRVCNLAGVSYAQQQLATFAELQNAIEVSLRELEAQRQRDQIAAKALMVLKVTKTSCDAFIALGAILSGKGRVLKAAYGVAGVAADSASIAATGGNVDYFTAGLTATKAAAGAAPAVPKFLIKQTAIKIELLVGAMNGDMRAVRKSTAAYLYELGAFSLGALEHKAAHKFIEIVKEGIEYNQKLSSTLDEFLSQRNESDDRYTQFKSMFQMQARRIQKKIDELDAFLQSCVIQLP